MIERNPSFLYQVGNHIEFLALTLNLSRGVKQFETHLPWSLETLSLFDRFRFALAAELLFERVRESGTTSLRIRLPESFAGFQESGSYEVAALASWAASDAVALAQRFDARNGNGAFARRIVENRLLAAHVTPFPLTGSGATDGRQLS
jgi:hypothetical protein